MMRIAKRDNGWWIIDVPSTVAGGERFTNCGPYATKAAPRMTSWDWSVFFASIRCVKPACPVFPQRPTPPKSRATHWFIRSLEFKPLKFRKPKPFKYSPRQKMLPGFELV